MLTATSKKMKTPTSLAERINLAKRRLAFLERLAESKRDVAAGRVGAPIKKARDLLR